MDDAQRKALGLIAQELEEVAKSLAAHGAALAEPLHALDQIRTIYGIPYRPTPYQPIAYAKNCMGANAMALRSLARSIHDTIKQEEDICGS